MNIQNCIARVLEWYIYKIARTNFFVAHEKYMSHCTARHMWDRTYAQKVKYSTIWQNKVLCDHFLFSFWTVCQFWTVTVRLILAPAESPISLPNLRKLITAKSNSDHQQLFLIINACAKSSQTESQAPSRDTEMCIITAQTKLPMIPT